MIFLIVYMRIDYFIYKKRMVVIGGMKGEVIWKKKKYRGYKWI